MKQKIIFLTILLLLTVGGFGIHLALSSQFQKNEGYLQVRSTPDAIVFVDSNAEGRTPLQLALKPGVHTVKIIPQALDPAQAVSAVPWEGKAEVIARQTTFVRRELKVTENESGGEVVTIQKSKNAEVRGKGEIYVQSAPEGANISLDGLDIGVAPDLLQEVSVGTHEVSVYLPRFLRRTLQINVVPGGYTTHVVFSLGIDADFARKFPFGAMVDASSSAALPAVSKSPQEPTPTAAPDRVKVLETPTGFLRVRTDPSLSGKEIAQVKPGETYPFVESVPGWSKIELTDGNEGWVSAEYVQALNE